MEKDSKIYVAGHRGMVGSAFVWTYRTELEEGIRLSYEDFLSRIITKLYEIINYWRHRLPRK